MCFSTSFFTIFQPSDIINEKRKLGDSMLRFGIIGAGKIAHRFAQAAIGVNETIQAIASRDQSHAIAFQEQYHIPSAYGNYLELFQDPLVDIVYIATPHGFHFEHMMAALEHDKHVLCEKAFTLNQKQAKQVFELANKKKRFCMEAMWTRFLPVIQEAKSWVNQDLIGEIIQIDATFAFPAHLHPESRLIDPHLGGGALLDIGIYPITIANLFLGKPLTIESTCKKAESGVDLANQITFTYPQAEANLISSFVDEECVEAFIYGTKGYIQIPSFHGAQTAMLFDRNHKIIKEFEHKHLVNGLEYEIFETVRQIKKKALESPLMSQEDTLEILRQMDEIRASWDLKYPQESK